jgi:hypothetical protein
MLDRRLRLLGVRAGGLRKADALPAPLSADADTDARDQLLLPMFGASTSSTPRV